MRFTEIQQDLSESRKTQWNEAEIDRLNDQCKKFLARGVSKDPATYKQQHDKAVKALQDLIIALNKLALEVRVAHDPRMKGFKR